MSEVLAEKCAQSEKSKKRAVWALIWLCWLPYAASYVGKVNYAANINQVMEYYSVDHAQAGLVSTFLFFSYGIGQFINGFLCKKYNIRWMIFLSLTVSGAANLAVAFTPSFAVVKYLWLINGLALSILWATTVRLLTETLSKRDMAKATLVMGTTVASGTLAIYGLSAIFTVFDAFKLAFAVAGVLLPAVAVLWAVALPGVTRRAKAASLEYEAEDAQKGSTPTETQNASSGAALYIMIAVLAIFAVAVNLINDGLKTWVPSIMKETYGLGDSLSIVLSLALPLVAIFSNVFSVWMHEKFPNFVLQCGISFAGAALVMGIVIAGLSLGQFATTLLGFAAVCFLIASCNNLITGVFPLFMKDKINSGRIAGVLNGFCYLGSTISSYGLGVIADNGGWNAVFYLLLGVCLAIVLIAAVYLACVGMGAHKNKN